MSADNVRATIAAISKRAAEDAEYQQQLKANPRETLVAAGVPVALVEGVIAADAEEPDVHGYIEIASDTGCNDFTCFTSNCPSTCHFSNCGTTHL